jgi:hypothetical protein
LRDLGRNVWLYDLAPTRDRTAEGALALNALTGPRQPLEDMRLSPDDVVLDGLFGAGLSRSLSGEAAFAAEQVNASGAKVVAIDVPSGINGDSGAVPGLAIRADVTVTFCAKKPAHVLQPAASLCGDVIPAEIGFGRFVAEIGQGRLQENGPALWAHSLRWPEASSHKHQRGRLAVVTGGLANTGAARLAAQAGLRTGAGLVTLLCPPGALIVVASSVTAVMTSSFASSSDLVSQTKKSSAVVIGPAAGVTDANARQCRSARAGRAQSRSRRRRAHRLCGGQSVQLRAILSAPAILTPHTGEFERLFPGLLATVRKPDRRCSRRGL